MTSSVFDLQAFDRSVRPQDDLFRFVNGTWLANTTIPDDKATAGAFIELRDQAEEAVRNIITQAKPDAEHDAAGQSPEQKIALLYASFMDTERIEALGTQPLHEDLEAVEAVDSTESLSRWFGTSLRRGIGGALDIDLDSDPGDPQRNLVFVGQSGLGLPDEEYYREDQYREIREKYVAHVEKMLSLAGFEDAAEQAQAVLDLETRIASHHWDKVTVRDLTKMYNPMTFTELAEQVSRLDWYSVLLGVGLTEDQLATVVNAQPSFFTGLDDLDELLTDELLPAWKSWARWHVVSARASYLPEAFVNENFAFYGTVLSGTPQLKDRWKRGVALVNGALGEAVGELYVQEHFPPVAKARMDELVDNLLGAYRDSIETLDWMTEDTRAEALKKLSGFTPKIGYPEKWKDYSALFMDGQDLVGNVVRTSQFAVDEIARKAGQPVEKHEWLMTPQTVNAYYHPLRNEIVFPAAILQPPFFSQDADDAVNYGGIGAVIGHEIGHGFDDKGSTCDGDGKLRNWWTDADREAFESRTARLVDQYAALSPAQFEGSENATTLNGELTRGENNGDLGGLSIAYKAWRAAQDKKDIPDTEPVDGFTPAQRLFVSWAYVWQEKSRDEALKTRIATDPHSPAEFRAAQTPRNVDAFYEAFDVQKSDRMWLPQEERVAIW